MKGKAKNRIVTPFTQAYVGVNSAIAIDSHIRTSDSIATGDYEAKVVGIVMPNSSGGDHVQISGYSVSTQSNFYPSSNSFKIRNAP